MAIDCLVVGHHESSIDELAARLEPSRNTSGGFLEIETNSVQWGAQRLTFPELINSAINEAHGVRMNIAPFKAPHAGAIFLANRLRSAGVETEVINYVSPGMTELDRALNDLQPRTVVLTSTYYVEEAPLAALVQCTRRASPSASVIVGGPFVNSRISVAGDGAVASLSRVRADVYIYDPQGEQTLISVVNAALSGGADPFNGIANTVRLVSGRLLSGPKRTETNELDSHRVRWGQFRNSLKPKVAFLRTARGCAFHCAFCNYPAMSGAHATSSIDATCDEIEALRAEGVKDIAFVDDTFNVPLPRFKALLKQIIARDLDIRWTSFFRCSNADVEAFDLMAASGCQAVFLGIESGDPAVLKLMNKAAVPKSYSRGISALTERGILTMGSFIVGFPGETTETIQNTLAFITENPTTYHNFQLYYHDRLAPVEKMRNIFGIEGSAYAWSHVGMDWREAADWVRYAMASPLPSTPIPLYGFSIWALPYFQALGVSRPQFEKVCNVAGQALRASIAGELKQDRVVADLASIISQPQAQMIADQLQDQDGRRGERATDVYR